MNAFSAGFNYGTRLGDQVSGLGGWNPSDPIDNAFAAAGAFAKAWVNAGGGRGMLRGGKCSLKGGSGGTGGGGGNPIPTFRISRSKNPDFAENVENALNAGHPSLLTRGDPALINETRAVATSPVPSPRPGGKTVDEYPFAASAEAQANPGGSWIGLIDGKQNSSGGGLLSAFFEKYGVKMGDKFYVKIVP